MDDHSLIIAAREGDITAFSELVRQHQGRVRTALAVRMSCVHDAEDLAQEAFVIAFRKLREFEVGREFGPWVRSIAINLLKNYQRKHRAEPLGGASELEGLLNRQLDGACRTDDESDRLSALRYCITKLSGDLKALLHKHYFLGVSVAELTRESGVKHSAMTMRLHRMREQLRQCISEREGRCPL